jgi:hypothetical protein
VRIWHKGGIYGTKSSHCDYVWFFFQRINDGRGWEIVEVGWRDGSIRRRSEEESREVGVMKEDLSAHQDI